MSQKISEMTAVVTPATSDYFPVIQGGTNKRETIAQALSLLSGSNVNTALGYTAANAASVLPLAGGTMTGALTLSGAPTLGGHATTKTYVDGLISGLGATYATDAEVAAALTAYYTSAQVDTLLGGFATTSALASGLAAKQDALGFTPENAANRNASGGYAGLTAGKIASAQIAEVLAVTDLTTYASVSGSGTAALAATITTPASGNVLKWSGSNWVNDTIAGILGYTPADNAALASYATTSALTSGLAGKQDSATNLTQLAGLTDPNADRLVFWDDSAGSYAHLQLGTNLSITGTTINASGSGGVSIGDSIGSATAGRLLFVGAGPVLADDGGLTYDPTTNALTFAGATSGSFTLSPAGALGSQTWKLPTGANFGSAATGMALTITDLASGQLGWDYPEATGIGGVISLNALTDALTLALGTTAQSGDLGIVSSGTTITVHVPDAATSTRGVVSTGAQSWSGVKTLLDGLATSAQAALAVGPFGTSAGNTGEARFLELAANGTNYTGFKAPDALAGNAIYTLPTAFPGTNGYLLSSTTAGVLSWTAPGSASLAVGGAITGGTAGRVLFEDSSNQLGEDAGLTYNAASDTLTAGSLSLTTALASSSGGTGNGFTKFTGPTTSEKTFTLPNASSTILTDNAAVTVAQGGTGSTSASAARTALGLAIGSDVQAFSSVLSKWAAYSDPGADKLIYWRDSDNTIQSVTIGSGLSFSSGSLAATGGAGSVATDTIWDAAGDLAVGSGADTAARLAKGTDGQVLTMVSGAVAWANASSGFADPMTTRGDLIYRNSSNATARLPVGVNRTFVRSDGTDAAWGAIQAADVPDLSATYQPLDGDLTALAALSSTGLLARTASNTYAQRTITGTANKITVTNGDGVSGNPTLTVGSDIVDKTASATYSAGTTHTFGANASVAGVNLGSVAGAPSTVNDSDVWYDSTQKALSARVAGKTVFLNSGIWANTADVTIANTTTETSVFGTGVGSLTLPANYFTAGKTLRVTVMGYNSTAASAGNLTLKLKLGTTSLFNQTLTLSNSNSNVVYFDFLVTCRSTGASGSFQAQIRPFGSISGTVSSTAAVTVDTTASQTLDVTWTWGTASASNTVTITNGLAAVFLG